jgi:ribonuclease HII
MMTHPQPNLIHESKLFHSGLRYIAGIDEAGRGAWAGPVVAAAIILPLELDKLTGYLSGVRDSKVMTPRARKAKSMVIQALALCVGVGYAEPAEIDDIGILPATRLAMYRAIAALSLQPEHLLIDYLTLPEIHLPQTAIPKGDGTVLSIAAASVIAKVRRDERMIELDRLYPGYGFARHKGYGTPQHYRALRRMGPSVIHRHSFRPIRSLLSETA